MTRKEDWPQLYQPQNLDPDIFNWPSVDEPQTYVEKQAGRYVKMLEGLLSEALAQRNLGQAESIIVNLLRMTAVGRPRADLNLKGEPLDELDLSHVSDAELERIVGKVGRKDGNDTTDSAPGSDCRIDDPGSRRKQRHRAQKSSDPESSLGSKGISTEHRTNS